MRKLIIIFVFASFILPAFADDTSIKAEKKAEIKSNQEYIIKPHQITRKETKNWKMVNQLSEIAFKKLNVKIDTAQYSFLENRFNPDNKDLYYELLNKDTAYIYYQKKLSQIVFKSDSEYPRIEYLYSYPEGELLRVCIQLSLKEGYDFNKYGEYIDYKSYISNLKKKIRKNWYRFNYRDNKQVKVMFVINKTGKLIEYKIVESSGSKTYDEDAIAALKSSIPFDPLPLTCMEDYVIINFTFDLKKKSFKDLF